MNMENPTVILVNGMKTYFEAIMDVIESQLLTDKAEYAQKIEQAIELIPEKGKCLIVTESLIPSRESDGRGGSVKMLLREGKKKNPECKFVLYSFSHYDLDLRDFEKYINFADRGGYEDLICFITEFCGKECKRGPLPLIMW